MRAGPGTAFALLLVLALAACADRAPTPDAPSSPAPSASPAPRPTPTTPAAASGSPGPSRATVVLDRALLDVLPADVAGVALTLEPEAFAQAAADPDFVANVEAAAFATAVDGNDLASGVVARLKPDVFSDAFFRDWRDSYDAGACSQAGGVTGHAQAEIGGRTVYITSCAEGLRTYHVHLPERDLLVSLFSLGERRFGEAIMGALRP